ncbi:MAG: DUF6799 domain-containing protein [Bacteroidia bacterium]
MKKLFVIIAAVLTSSAVFAQTDDAKTATPATPPTPATAPASSAPPTTMTGDHTAMPMHQCYMMKDNALMHCTGTDATAQKADVTLKNGTVISAKGEITPKEGAKTQMANGQCCDMMGMVGDCEKMHAGMKMMDKKKEPKSMDAK